ncbi:hypothetical protein JXA63_02595 [Candidatus Woesebacteria bacterium]|nr:hypothetical protein [Candidatus Woesebacteria bacterium]
MKQLIKKAKELAFSEIKKYGAPSMFNFKLSNVKGQMLSEKYNADKNIVLLGTILMDLKIGQALQEDKLKDHVKMSIVEAKSFLEKHTNNKPLIEKVLHCIKAHHGTIEYKSKEAEIVANADCYRFVTISGFLRSIADFSKEGMSFNKVIDLAEYKVKEKWSTVSLSEVKAELQSDYKFIMKLVKQAKEGQAD